MHAEVSLPPSLLPPPPPSRKIARRAHNILDAGAILHPLHQKAELSGEISSFGARLPLEGYEEIGDCRPSQARAFASDQDTTRKQPGAEQRNCARKLMHEHEDLLLEWCQPTSKKGREEARTSFIVRSPCSTTSSHHPLSPSNISRINPTTSFTSAREFRLSILYAGRPAREEGRTEEQHGPDGVVLHDGN